MTVKMRKKKRGGREKRERRQTSKENGDGENEETRG